MFNRCISTTTRLHSINQLPSPSAHLLDHRSRSSVQFDDWTRSPAQSHQDRASNSPQLLKRPHASVWRVVSILLPFVIALAFLIALSVDNSVEAFRLQAHIDEETAIAQKLAQANSDYESSKANFAAFRSLLDNLISLRNRQPATHQLLTDLNRPLAQRRNLLCRLKSMSKAPTLKSKEKPKTNKQLLLLPNHLNSATVSSQGYSRETASQIVPAAAPQHCRHQLSSSSCDRVHDHFNVCTTRAAKQNNGPSDNTANHNSSYSRRLCVSS